MAYKKHIIRELETIIEEGLKDAPIPIKKGNSIRIKWMVIRESRYGYLVYDAKTNMQVARTFSRATAIAIAKNMAEGKDVTKRVLELDVVIQKNYNDAIFYKNTIKKAKDEVTRATRECRLELAMDKTQRAKQELDKFIFGL